MSELVLTSLRELAEPLVALGGWHPHVDDRDVRAMLEDGLHERRAVADLGHHDTAGVADEACQALPDERRVLGDDDPQGRVVHAPIMHQSAAAAAVLPLGRTGG